MYQNGTDYNFMPIGNTFRYPQMLDYYEVEDADQERIAELAEKWSCNYYTVKECIRAIMAIRDGD